MSTDPFEMDWQSWQGREDLVETCAGDETLARLVYRVVGKTAFEYLDSRPPVLEGRTPRSMLRSQPGRRELRRVLNRFPYI